MVTHSKANKSSQLKRLAQDVIPVDCVENPEDPDCFPVEPVDPDFPVEPDCPDCFEPEVEEDNHSVFNKLVEWMNTMEQKIESLSSLDGEVAGLSSSVTVLEAEVSGNSASLETLSSLEGKIYSIESDISALKSGQTTCVAGEATFGGAGNDQNKETKTVTFSVAFVASPAVSFGITKLTAPTNNNQRDAIVEIQDSSLTGTGVTFTINHTENGGALRIWYMACGHTML